jgi:hypothetical protein
LPILLVVGSSNKEKFQYDVAAASFLAGWQVYEILLTNISLIRQKLQQF